MINSSIGAQSSKYSSRKMNLPRRLRVCRSIFMVPFVQISVSLLVPLMWLTNRSYWRKISKVREIEISGYVSGHSCISHEILLIQISVHIFDVTLSLPEKNITNKIWVEAKNAASTAGPLNVQFMTFVTCVCIMRTFFFFGYSIVERTVRQSKEQTKLFSYKSNAIPWTTENKIIHIRWNEANYHRSLCNISIYYYIFSTQLKEFCCFQLYTIENMYKTFNM